MTLRAADAWANDARLESSQSGKGIFVICQNPLRILVFIRMALLAYGDKQRSGAAKMWERIRARECRQGSRNLYILSIEASRRSCGGLLAAEFLPAKPRQCK
jgi:hypothetical protein